MRVLVAVAARDSSAAAAEALHYAQPSVSHQLAKLEAEVGVPLLQRMGRGIRLTEAGRLLVDRAESILAQVEVRARRTGRAGRTAHRPGPAGGVPLGAGDPGAARPPPACPPNIPPSNLTLREPRTARRAQRPAQQRRGDVALIFEHGDPPQRDRRDTTR
ncbi:LysR family transcriptional regulator [Streptomyces sp. L7]